jgi:streptogramin lyase
MKRFFYLPSIILLLFFSHGCAIAAQPSATLVPTIAIPQASRPEPALQEQAPPVELAPPVEPAPIYPDGAIWVPNPEDRAILQIDPQTNQIAATIRLEGQPDKIALGEGAVWVLDATQGRVFRIRPGKNRADAVVQLPNGKAADITAGAGSVWVGMTGAIDLNQQIPGQEGGEVSSPGFIARIDPQKAQVIEQFAAQPVSQLMLHEEALWALSAGIIDTPLQLFDLADRQAMVVPLQNGPEWLPVDALAADAENLWLYSAAYGRIFHATTGGIIRSAIALEERQPLGRPALLVDESGLWAITTWGTVLHIDPETNRVLGQIDLNAPLTGLSAGSGSIWVLSQQTAMLFRIDPGQHTVAAQIETGSLVLPTVAPTPTSRVVLRKPCPDGPTSRLQVGETVYVTKDPPIPNRVRREPTREAEILGLIGPGGGMDIIDGPACADGWVWWKVKNADLEGWTPEGDAETYWLIPLNP